MPYKWFLPGNGQNIPYMVTSKKGRKYQMFQASPKLSKKCDLYSNFSKGPKGKLNATFLKNSKKFQIYCVNQKLSKIDYMVPTPNFQNFDSNTQ